MKFADTGWWVGWTLVSDDRHEAAVAAALTLGRTEQLVTTNLVVGETWTFLRRKDSHRVGIAFLDRTEQLAHDNRLVVHRVSEAEEAVAWKWLRRHDERVYSFVDATSFEVMRRRRLREAFAFDSDFAAAGFLEIHE